jgi:diguanylate cyclase (GGDEF)-like protein
MRTIITWLQPRDHAVAARTVAVLCVVAAAVTIVFALAESPTADHRVTVPITLAAASAVVAAGLLSRRLSPDRVLVWGSCPFIATAVIVGLDILSSDSSIAAQIFFIFPALYGASQLRRPGALCVCAATIIGEIAVVAVVAPTRTGWTDAVYLSAALLTTVGLLIDAGLRQDALVGQLQRQAAIDPLTGLATRRVLDHAAQSALSGAASGDGTAMILIDIDDFKSVNDQFGHPSGDEVLMQLARLLSEGCRGDDIVSRLGGDEIALLLPGCSQEAMVRRADQIIWDVRAAAFRLPDGQVISISVSAGVAHAPTQADDVRSLYAAADAALYEAKRRGRNRFIHVTPDRLNAP